MARTRGRPVENRWVGLRMSDPPLDLAKLARRPGRRRLRTGAQCRRTRGGAAPRPIAEVQAGATCVIDVRVAPEYARAVSSALLRQIPNDH